MTCLALCLISFFGMQSDTPPTALVEFLVTVPADTPADAKLYISGACETLGNWKADGLLLERSNDGRYGVSVHLPTNTMIEYKITRGTWQTVERNAGGGDVANRRVRITGPKKETIRVARWSPNEPEATQPARRSTLTGDIRFHRAFKSKYLNNARTLTVYLPSDYDKNEKTRYPVLYMHDGQNLFDAATSYLGIEWEVDEHAERLIRANRIHPIIIVGIESNDDRSNELSPDFDAGYKAGGKGELYAKFLIEEVKPFIDRTYRTLPDREHTGVAGSSLGGLISLYICHAHPDTFSMCGAVSPALMWHDGKILDDIRKQPDWLQRTRIWLDMGTAEGRQIDRFSDAVVWTRKLEQIFDEARLVPGRDYYYQEVAGGEHNEAHWARRFDKILLYFFGK